MKALVASCAAVALLAGPAFAKTHTIKFVTDDGDESVWTFDDETMTAASDEISDVPFTWDEEALKLCGEMPEIGEVCATFAEMVTEPGGSTTYTMNDGATGVATLVSVEE